MWIVSLVHIKPGEPILAHSAFADLGGDGMRPEGGAGAEHGCLESADYSPLSPRHTKGDPERSPWDHSRSALITWKILCELRGSN